MTEPVIMLTVSEDGITNRLQLAIRRVDKNGAGTGYRLAGPKFNGTGTTLIAHVLTADDAAEIRQHLNMAFPPGDPS